MNKNSSVLPPLLGAGAAYISSKFFGEKLYKEMKRESLVGMSWWGVVSFKKLPPRRKVKF
jgi:hypothetical protein